MVSYGGYIGLSDISAFNPQIWSTEVFYYRLEALKLLQYVTRLGFTGQPGDTIRRPRVSRLGVFDKADKQPVTYQTVSETEWTMRVQRSKESSFRITDTAMLFSHTDLRRLYAQEVGRALARDLEYAILGQRAAIGSWGSNGTVFPNRISASTSITKAEILAAEEALDRRLVPQEGRVWIMGKAHRAALLSQAALANTPNIGDTGASMPARTGNPITPYGTPVVFADLLVENSLTGLRNGDNDSAPGPTPGMAGSLYYPTQEEFTVYSNTLTAGRTAAILLYSDAIAMAMKKMPSMEMARDIDYQAWKCVSTQIYDLKCLRPDSAIIVETDENAALPA